MHAAVHVRMMNIIIMCHVHLQYTNSCCCACANGLPGRGDVTVLRGDATMLRGDATALHGDATALRGDVAVAADHVCLTAPPSI